jgi:uncharacterized protein YfaS (alpha-2-macroglobulin family)
MRMMRHCRIFRWAAIVRSTEELSVSRFCKAFVLASLLICFCAHTQAATPPLWTEVDRLTNEQKYQAALDKTAEILQASRRTHSSSVTTEALIRSTQLQLGLHGYETAVRFLKSETWPQGDSDTVLLNLYYAHALMFYEQMYGWEINAREKTDSKEKVDLKSWTRGEIGLEINRAFDAAMSVTKALAEPVPEFMRAYISRNSFPPKIRPTLRDAVVYMTVDHLANQQEWTPQQANEIYKLDIAKLAELKTTKRIAAADATAHPLEKIASWLGEHQQFHLQNSRPEAALEAQYQVLELLNAAVTEIADKKALIERLRQVQLKGRELEWWSRGQALLAELVIATTKPDRMIEARRDAQAGIDAHSGSPGAQMCRSIVFDIERTTFSMQEAVLDAAKRRSVLVTYRNAKTFYFRAYALNFEEQLKQAKKGYAFPSFSSNETQQLVRSGAKILASWRVETEPTSDYLDHRLFVQTPDLKVGQYLIAMSLNENFSDSNNQIESASVSISDLVTSVRADPDGTNEIKVVSGETGRPAVGAQVTLYRYTWEKAPSAVLAQTVNADGRTIFKEQPRDPNSYWNYFYVTRLGSDVAPTREASHFSKSSEPGATSGAFIYSDRSIYRPGQKVLFKVIGYSGNSGSGHFETVKAGQPMTIRLMDPNNKAAGELALLTNSFGTVSGELSIPSGRPLGQWRIWSSTGGNQNIRVEEYKRPTFEVEFKTSDVQLRLNQKAKLTGDAHYYFGLPVTSGLVKWRVTRTEVTPWWWGYWGWGRSVGARASQSIASGVSTLNAKGEFNLEFKPEADDRKAAHSDLTYNFTITADMTDEGGETRSATKTIRLGFVTVETSLNWEVGFFEKGRAVSLNAKRTTLDGKGQKGTGTYQVARLIQPKDPTLPADLPRSQSSGEQARGEQTSGDKLRARWETDFDWTTVTRNWKEGQTILKGAVQHDGEGEGKIRLKPIAESGVYRLSYETKDAYGQTFKVSRDFVIAGAKSEINLPLLFLSQTNSVHVGQKARFILHSGLASQPLVIEKFRSGRRIDRRNFVSGKDNDVFEFSTTKEDRGGYTVVVSGVRDHQILHAEQAVTVPWSDRELKLEFATFRDHLRPGTHETFRVSVKDDGSKLLGAGVAEVLAYMYDRSLDLFTPHIFPTPASVYPTRFGSPNDIVNLGLAPTAMISNTLPTNPGSVSFIRDNLMFNARYGIGGPGARGGRGGGEMMELAEDGMAMASPMMSKSSGRNAGLMQDSPSAPASFAAGLKKSEATDKLGSQSALHSETKSDAAPPRSNFSETAFFLPHLITNAHGQATMEFDVPDSVTSWRVLAHAITRDMRSGSVSKETKSVKELMVRPYIPRFMREADAAEIKVSVNNASTTALSGDVTFDIEDAETGKSVIAQFGLKAIQNAHFKVAAQGTTTLGFSIVAPKKVGLYAFKVIAKTNSSSGSFSDGERRPFPVLPSRLHLAQSRFVTLRNKDHKVLEFKDLAAGADPSLINEKMVVTVDGQLFYGVLQALPYLTTYPYECMEQTLNRFLSTGIVTSVFDKYPAVAKMAKEFSNRKTQLESFNDQDPNRRMTLEETPWLEAADGGSSDSGLVNVLNADVAKASRENALERLRKMQLPSGGFPWFEGGPADNYMTVYLLMGFSRALEFKVDVPKDMTIKAWSYVREWLDRDLQMMMAHDCCSETVTMVNYALSSYPDESWTGKRFDLAYRKRLLDYSFSHWKDQAPLIKGYLALTLKRMGRPADAKLVWDSVMDSAKFDDQLGTYWAAEDRSWLWYNDTIETHAFSLRVQMELNAKDKHNDGLVQWLFLNKKLNHWKSTRATAEVIYSLVGYLNQTGGLGQRENISVDIGGQQKTQFAFEPDKYTGKKNQIVVPGEKVTAQTAKITVDKSTPGFAFASATWHFSTEKLPVEASGDFFHVTRAYFKREQVGSNWQLKPLAEGATISVGDQIEVHLSLQTKHEAEYVHLQDPRAAGLEPETLNSGYKWDLGISWYEETRDSGSNFFFSQLPVGEYAFKYRLRANMAGTFRVGPATVQSMYAPEFNAYSQGSVLKIAPAK